MAENVQPRIFAANVLGIPRDELIRMYNKWDTYEEVSTVFCFSVLNFFYFLPFKRGMCKFPRNQCDKNLLFKFP